MNIAIPASGQPASDAVLVATPSMRGALYQTLKRAFSNDPVLRWMFPDPALYASTFSDFAEALAGRSIADGTAYSAAGNSGAALWLRPDAEPDEETLFPLLEQSMPAPRLETFGTAIEALDACHPDQPFWYLALLGVDPTSQGRGVGSALLVHALAQCDAERKPAYLEATCERNAALYERHGFERVGIVQIGDGVSLIPMQRPAR